MVLTIYIAIFLYLADLDAENHPVLFHCTAQGPHGFCRCCITEVSGVDDETIVVDYLLTNTLLGDRTEERLQAWAKRMANQRGTPITEINEEALGALRILMLTHADMLQSTFDAVDELCGSWDEMRRTGLGISDEKMAAPAKPCSSRILRESR